MKKWVEQLGDEAFAVREEASAKLKLLGEAALPELERTRTTADDLETRRRAERLIRTIEAGRPDRLFLRPLDWAVVRLLGRTGTTREAAEALVAYVPCASEDETIEALYEALDRMHARGLAGEALRRALKSEHAGTRALAGCVLGKSDEAAERAAVRPLLKDRDAEVRLRTAQGLLAAMRPEREALPVLAELLGENSRAVAWQAEELLRFAAGASSPEEVLGSHEAKRRERVRAAWRAWWRANATIDLTRLHASGRRPGLVMVHLDHNSEEKVQVIGGEGKVLCEVVLSHAKNGSRVVFRPDGEMVRFAGTYELNIYKLNFLGQQWLLQTVGDYLDACTLAYDWSRRSRIVFQKWEGHFRFDISQNIASTRVDSMDEFRAAGRLVGSSPPVFDVDGYFFCAAKSQQEPYRPTDKDRGTELVQRLIMLTPRIQISTFTNGPMDRV